MAVFSRTKTWVSNEVLTASDLNGEINNLLNNTKPESIEDYSADVATMQTTADPGGVGTESLATTLAGELTRIRFKLKQMMNGAQWYSTPVSTLGNLGILTASINDLAVTTGKINDLAVTRGKQAAVGQQLSSSCANFSTSSTSFVDVTNLTVTITTTGRPVVVGLIPDGSVDHCFIGRQAGDATYVAIQFYLKLLRDATTIASFEILGTINTSAGHSSTGNFITIDPVSAGTYTYKLQFRLGAGGVTSGNVAYYKLIAYEL